MNFLKMLDYIFNKVLPKKLIVFMVGTYLALPGVAIITGGQWLTVALVYAGVNLSQKLLERVTNARNDSNVDRRSGDGDSRNRGADLDAS